jgi:hypothetical protein
MATSAADEKKRIERLYLEEARQASVLLPSGDLVAHERPDFLLHAAGGIVGIEVTELCREEDRAEGGKLSKVAGKAKVLYNSMPGAQPVDVGAAFAPHAGSMKFHALATSLANFVYRNRDKVGSSFKRELPEGYCHIGFFEPLSIVDTRGCWRIAAAFDVEIAVSALLADRI